MNALPESFTRTIVALYGDVGVEWLQNLPNLLSACARRWSLRLLPPCDPLSYNYVAPVLRADGAEAILKVGVPNPELTSEIDALRFYDGHGIVRLLDADPEQGALLEERLRPGTMLSTLADDDEATAIAAGVMQQLWRPAPAQHSFPTVARWAAGLQKLRPTFGGGYGPFPADLVDRAEGLFAELLASEQELVLLHGDLHHYNILAAEREPWLAIDPKGLIGERGGYECGPFLYNPVQIASVPHLERVLSRRIDILVERLGLDRQRVIGWALAAAVLSAWWSYEGEGQTGQEALTVAAALAKL